jgi:uncharacterized protein (DUF2336 family)
MHRHAELVSLAKETSSDKRRELLHNLTDLFLEGAESIADRESHLFGDVVCRILDEVVTDARRDLAERVADIDSLPPDIARRLASDVIEVALPVLERSKQLTDKDLIAIAEEKSQEHLMAISRRNELREHVTDILVRRGEQSVLHALTENCGAHISDQSFGILAEKAEGDETLQESLIGRPDMPTSAARKLEGLVQGELKQRLKTMSAVAMRDDFEKYVARAKNRLESALRDSHKQRLEVRLLITAIRDESLSLSDGVKKLAKENRPVHLGWLIADTADIPEAIVSNAVSKENGVPVAVLCKALELTEDAFRAVALMRCRRQRRPASEADRLVEQYGDLNFGDCQRTMRFLKVRHAAYKSKQAA